MKKKWITFDLDGTLMQNPFEKWVFPEIEQLYNDSIGNVQANGIRSELIKEHRRRIKAGLIVDAYDWDDIVRHVFSTNGVSLPVDVAELVIKHTIPPKVYLLEENSLQNLQILREKGFHLAVVTNGFEKYQKPVMDALGLTSLFDVILTPDKARYGKPQINMVKELHDTTNEIVAHVGDRLDHDVTMANELNVLSILFHQEMPETIRSVQPKKRQDTCMEWLEMKWKQETGDEPLPLSAIPKMIICTMKEICRESLS
ncbi:HAD-IA family hydrolase [Ornithinibacillus sp. JPR2-1]|uniref:HAD family hydrolase n=1 Tax=Ornithinibacillus sp. JPR2-1 TaxID=2094019 RepID=UPI0031DCC9FA